MKKRYQDTDLPDPVPPCLNCGNVIHSYQWWRYDGCCSSNCGEILDLTEENEQLRAAIKAHRDTVYACVPPQIVVAYREADITLWETIQDAVLPNDNELRTGESDCEGA